MSARYVVRITPADVGARVSIRTRLASSGDGPGSTDTLGHLRSWSAGVLEVERADGSVVRLAEADLLAARRIPPAPVRRRPGTPP